MLSAAVRRIIDNGRQQHRRVLRQAEPVIVPEAANESDWVVDALPHQVELFNDLKSKILGLCSVFGGGKSWAAARKAVQLALLNPGCDGIVTEPTIPLLVKVMFPALEDALRSACENADAVITSGGVSVGRWASSPRSWARSAGTAARPATTAS